MANELDHPVMISLENEASAANNLGPQSAAEPHQSAGLSDRLAQPPLAADLPQRTQLRTTRAFFFKSTAAVAILACAIFAGWRLGFFQSDLDKGRRALAEAFRKQRPSEARFTHFEYAQHAETRGL